MVDQDEDLSSMPLADRFVHKVGFILTVSSSS